MSISLEYFPFTHDELPVKKVFEVNGTNYSLEIRYNDVFDFYSIYVYDGDDNLLFSAKLNYLTDALDAVCEELKIGRHIVPLNESDVSRDYSEIGRIGKENFDTMKICLI